MVLLVIDVQKGITDDRLYNFGEFLSNLKKLIAKAREQGTEVIYVQHDDGPGSGFSVGDVDAETTYRYYNEMMWPGRFAQCVDINEVFV